MKKIAFYRKDNWLLLSVILLLGACVKETEEVPPTEEQTWSRTAPHEPGASDIKQKLSDALLDGGYTPANDLIPPQFDDFEDADLITMTLEALSEQNVPPFRIDSLIALYQNTNFQSQANEEPNTGRLLITSVSHSNEVIREVSEATFQLLSEQLNRLIITDDFPANAGGASSFTLIDQTVYSRALLFAAGQGKDVRFELFNEAAEISYLQAGITPPSQNAQILQLLLQTLYLLHDYAAFLDGPNSGSLANVGIRDNLSLLFLSLFRPDPKQEALLNGQYLLHPDALAPGDNPNTPDFDESTLNTMNEIFQRLRATTYANAPNLPDQAVPQWFADQFETLTGSPMPNGNIADGQAITLAITACNTFLDHRPDDREVVKDYYGVEE
jgi:hypothetical protein